MKFVFGIILAVLWAFIKLVFTFIFSISAIAFIVTIIERLLDKKH